MEAVMRFARLTVLLTCLLTPPSTATKTPLPSSLQPVYLHLPKHPPPPPPSSSEPEPHSSMTEVKGTYNAKNHNQPSLSKLLAKLLSQRLSHPRKTPSPSTPSSKLLTGHLLKGFKQDRHSPAPPPSKRPANPLFRNPFHHTETQPPPPPPLPRQHETEHQADDVRLPLEIDSDHEAGSLQGGLFSGTGLQTAAVVVVVVDGVPLSELPPHLLLAAYLRQKVLGGMSRSRSSLFPLGKALRVGAKVTVTTAASGLDSTAFCQTEECVRLMQEYEQWRRQHGYGTSGGRWG